MRTFQSNFADFMDGMIAYQEAMGHKRITYETILLNFDGFCLLHYPDRTELDKDMVLKWLEKRPAETSVGLYSRAWIIRVFGRYLNALGIRAFILPDKFVSSKRIFTPYIFTDEELGALFAAADSMVPVSTDSFRHYIFPVYLRLVYTCGLRPAEGRELSRKNINLSSGEVLITKTKTRKERIVVMSDDMLSSCRSYAARRDIAFPDSDYFFPNPVGATYSNQGFNRMFQSCWRRAYPDVEPASLPKVRIYDLRHRFASAVLIRWIDAKKDLYAMLPYLRSYMGHEQISSTAYYIHILPDNLIKSSGINWEDCNDLIPEADIWPD